MKGHGIVPRVDLPGSDLAGMGVFHKEARRAIFPPTPSLTPWPGCATMIGTKLAAEVLFSAPSRAERGRRARSVASSVGTVLCALLVPKCPLCVAAWLGAAGIGAGAATLVAPFVRPAALLLAALALLSFVGSLRRGRAARRAPAAAGGNCGCAATGTRAIAGSPGYVRRG
jgi:hypothetical protein